MKQNKSKKIIIICIIIVFLTILIGGLVFAFVATDIFKSEKELFFKYGSQMFSKEDGFVNETVMAYYEKQKTNPYENDGTLSGEIVDDSLGSKLDKINNFNISFSGKVDVANSKSEQEISINYSDEVKFPLNYRQNGNNLGIQTKYIGSKYIAIKNEDVGNLLSSSSTSEISLDNIDNIIFSKEELTQLSNTYINNINQQLSNSNFTKITKSNMQGYKLTLKGKDLKNLLVSLLETIKTDQTILDKLDQILSTAGDYSTINEAKIDSIIEQINSDSNIEQNSIEITVYQSNNKLVQISIQINQNAKIDITKNVGTDEVQYNVVANLYQDNEKIGNLSFSAKYTGLQTMQTVNENYELGIEFIDDFNNGVLTKINSNISNEKEILNNLILDIKSNQMLSESEGETITSEDIENTLNSGTSEEYSKMKLGKVDDTKFSITFIDTNDKFIIDNTGKIVEEPEENEVIFDETEEDNNRIGYKYNYNNNVTFTNEIEIGNLDKENSLILTEQTPEYITNLSAAIAERLQKVNKEQMEKIGLSENENPIIYLIPILRIYTQADDIISNSGDTFDEMTISTFNAKFEQYQSNNLQGATTKGLLSTVLLNNTSGDNSSPQIKEINFDGQEYEVTEQNITLIKSNIVVEDKYKVEFEKDENTGLIYRVVINKV